MVSGEAVNDIEVLPQCFNIFFCGEAWAKDPLAAITLKNTLRSAFGGFKGMMGATEVYAAFVENGRTLDDDETGVYRRVLEIVFQYKEA